MYLNCAGSKHYMRSKLQYKYSRNSQKNAIKNLESEVHSIFGYFSSIGSGGVLESADPAAGREGGGHGWQGHHKEE
jgi:hypothetical protein